MKKRIKKEWLKRLRDPATKQGKGTLKNKDGCMCCLGVLFEIAVEEGIATVEYLSDYGYEIKDGEGLHQGAHNYITNGTGHTDLLSEEVKVWAGLQSTGPDVSCDGKSYVALAKLNDEGVPFLEIADLIEEQL